MMGKIIRISANGQWVVNAIEATPQLSDLKAAIGGGYLEVVPFFDSIEYAGETMRCVAFCDQDGKDRNLPINQFATVLWEVALARAGRQAINGRDYLVGDIAVAIGDAEFMAAL